MRIKNCLIITSHDSYIEIRPDEMHEFSGNFIVSEESLGDESAIRSWRGISKALT